MSRLLDKVALITGGNSRIGEAAVKLFAREGAKIVIAARREEEGERVVQQVRDRGGEAIFVKTDVSYAEDCQNVVSTTVITFGWLDVAVNAGIEVARPDRHARYHGLPDGKAWPDRLKQACCP